MDRTIDMSTPVTRGELKEEIASLEVRFDHKLEHWGGALLDRLVRSERRLLDELARQANRITSTERRLLDELARQITGSERRLLDELARHTGAIQESLAKQVSAIDDKYRELPPRVHRLEASVFGPEHESSSDR